MSSRESIPKILEDEHEYDEKSFSSQEDSAKQKLFPNLEFEHQIANPPISELRESIYSSRESVSRRGSLRMPQAERKSNKKSVSADFEELKLRRGKKERYMSHDVFKSSMEKNDIEHDFKGLFAKKNKLASLTQRTGRSEDTGSAQASVRAQSRANASREEPSANEDENRREWNRHSKECERGCDDRAEHVAEWDMNESNGKSPAKDIISIIRSLTDTASELRDFNRSKSVLSLKTEQLIEKNLAERECALSTENVEWFQSQERTEQTRNRFLENLRANEQGGTIEKRQINNINVFNNVGSSIINLGNESDHGQKTVFSIELKVNQNARFSPKSFHAESAQISEAGHSKGKKKRANKKIKILEQNALEKKHKKCDKSHLREAPGSETNIDNLPFHSSENNTNLMSETNSESLVSQSIQKRETIASLQHRSKARGETPIRELEKMREPVEVETAKRVKNKRNVTSFFEKRFSLERGALINNIKNRVSDSKFASSKHKFSKTFMRKSKRTKKKAKTRSKKQFSKRIIKLKKQLVGMNQLPDTSESQTRPSLSKTSHLRLSEHSLANQNHRRRPANVNPQLGLSVASTLGFQRSTKDIAQLRPKNKQFSKSLMRRVKTKAKEFSQYRTRQLDFRSPQRADLQSMTAPLNLTPQDTSESFRKTKSKGRAIKPGRFLKLLKNSKSGMSLGSKSIMKEMIKKAGKKDCQTGLSGSAKSRRPVGLQKSEKRVITSFNDYGIWAKGGSRRRNKSGDEMAGVGRRFRSTKLKSSERLKKGVIKSSFKNILGLGKLTRNKMSGGYFSTPNSSIFREKTQ